MLERGELFRGSIEDRYVAAFLDAAAGSSEKQSRADLIATAIEVLRVAALSSYENRAISSGVLLLDGDGEAERVRASLPDDSYPYSQALTAIKSFYRLSDGIETVFLVNRAAKVLDIVEVAQYAAPVTLAVPSAARYRPHALATADNAHICIVLSPSHEIKVFAEGVQTFSFRNARWHLLDLKAKYEMWQEALDNAALSERLFQTAVDLADSREGALFVVLSDPAAALPQLVAPADQLDAIGHISGSLPNRAQLLHMLRGRNVHDLNPAVLRGLARTDGATVLDRNGRLLAVGAILLHTEPPEPHSTLPVEGARTTAAMAAGRFGAVLKVSEDGLITFYDQQERIWDI
jgi:hypothetical protein